LAFCNDFLEQANNGINEMVWVNGLEKKALKPTSQCSIPSLVVTSCQSDREWLAEQRGAYGHIIRDNTTPIDLAVTLVYFYS
jgi:hypothetical protein